MLVPIEGEYKTAYDNALRRTIQRHDYSPMTARIMGTWWQDETGLKLVYNEMYDVLCIDFDDYHDAMMFLLKYSNER